jgi:hypothetical protein
VGRPSLLTIIYLVIGIVVASNRDYFVDVDGLRDILAAIIAVVLWPLILLGVDLDLGGDNNKKNGILFVGWAASMLARRRQA